MRLARAPLTLAALSAVAVAVAQVGGTAVGVIRLPGQAEPYRATFSYDLLVPRAGLDEDGTVRLAGPTVATFRFGEFAVRGPSPEVAAAIALRVELPESIANSVVHLNAELPEGYSESFLVEDSGPVAIPAEVVYTYDGTEVSRSGLDLSQRFSVAGAAAVTEAPGDKPPVTSSGEREPSDADLPWPWYIAGACLGLGAIALVVKAFAGRSRARAPGRGSTAPVARAPTPDIRSRRTPATPAPAGGPTQATPASPLSPTSNPSGMRISRRVATPTYTGFHPETQPRDFCAIAMSTLWDDSRVETLYLGYGATLEIDRFLRRNDPTAGASTASDSGGDGGGDWEHSASTPEIGGMLMGQSDPGPGDCFRVSIEKFVPLRARYQSVIRMDLDPMSIARDLSEAQDRYPALQVVGWFHTHPGHGLFLSAPDLKVQYNQFPSPHHFAMEIDPLSPRRDTAFFTYDSSGAMNNADSRRADAAWLSWTTLVDTARRYSNA